MPIILKSLIQSYFGSGERSNFEAVVLKGDQLIHFWRDNADPAPLCDVTSAWQLVSLAAGGEKYEKR